ncbi:RING-H2 finger protein ATL66-like [Andrographis paniculata]|uniref:RING-H2 finger protein ATL66-like n=1 Tax=Andrographis paniculata TaxID=175694 RepID=UPI0021E9A2F2|nr:RING-H2 finger protein ATL66-like [Andrographis paniculata]
MSYQHNPAALPYRWNDGVFAGDNKLQLRGESLFYVAVVFSAVILAALLFLYARWICSVGPVSPSAARAAAAPPVPPLAQGGLDLATINSFPILVYENSPSSCAATDGEGPVGCCICLGTFSGGDKLKMLPACRHRFHSDCVDKWLATRSSCPLCRASLRVDSGGTVV